MSLEKKGRRKKRGRDKREKEGGTKGERGTDRYTVVRSLSGKMPAGIHTPKKGSDTRGRIAIGTRGSGPRKQEVKKPTLLACVLHKLKASERELYFHHPTPLPGTLSLLISLLYGNPLRCILIHTFTA